ncbi:hypothetical protein EP10_002561 [Geobacillus icigianus]|uniref:Uncharacterized protein n=1 Tax=Geobacillus icigianus TaxID=1430331 RepID=A0ABU6BIH3_9BACL|nr:hypothetical protein [Geobacillus icigianus]
MSHDNKEDEQSAFGNGRLVLPDDGGDDGHDGDDRNERQRRDACFDLLLEQRLGDEAQNDRNEHDFDDRPKQSRGRYGQPFPGEKQNERRRQNRR